MDRWRKNVVRSYEDVRVSYYDPEESLRVQKARDLHQRNKYLATLALQTDEAYALFKEATDDLRTSLEDAVGIVRSGPETSGWWDPSVRRVYGRRRLRPKDQNQQHLQRTAVPAPPGSTKDPVDKRGTGRGTKNRKQHPSEKGCRAKKRGKREETDDDCMEEGEGSQPQTVNLGDDYTQDLTASSKFGYGRGRGPPAYQHQNYNSLFTNPHRQRQGGNEECGPSTKQPVNLGDDGVRQYRYRSGYCCNRGKQVFGDSGEGRIFTDPLTPYSTGNPLFQNTRKPHCVPHEQGKPPLRQNVNLNSHQYNSTSSGNTQGNGKHVSGHSADVPIANNPCKPQFTAFSTAANNSSGVMSNQSANVSNNTSDVFTNQSKRQIPSTQQANVGNNSYYNGMRFA